MTDKKDAYIDMGDGTKEFIEELALIELLQEDILFAGFGKNGYIRTELLVGCNDIFAWGVADCEKLPIYELEDLYKMYKLDIKWGVVKWCCIHRKSKPQEPIVTDMKKDNVWNEIMESLPDNIYGQ